MILYAVSMLTGIISLFAFKIIMDIFFEERRTSNTLTVLSYLFLWLVTSLELYFIDTPLTATAAYLTTLFIVSLNYKALMIKRLAAVGCIHIVNLAATGVFLTIARLFPDFIGRGYQMPYITINILTFLIALPLMYFKNIKKDFIDSPVIWIPTFVIPISAMLTMAFHQGEFFEAVIWLVICFMLFFLYDRLSAAYQNKLKSALHTQEKEYYYTQCQLMQESVESIKSIRHDMKFHLAAAKDYIAKNKPDQAEEYINGLLGDIEENGIYSNTNNTAFDSIINYKLSNAQQENLKPDIRLLIPPTLNIETADTVTILGNLLDNALDAVSEIDNKKLKLDIEYSRESLYIQVENTFDGVVKYAKPTEGEEKHVLTRKSGGEHGHGLKNVQKSVEKYNGHLDISHDKNIFSVGVLLYVNAI